MAHCKWAQSGFNSARRLNGKTTLPQRSHPLLFVNSCDRQMYSSRLDRQALAGDGRDALGQLEFSICSVKGLPTSDLPAPELSEDTVKTTLKASFPDCTDRPSA